MRLFAKTKKQEGWLAVAFCSDGVCAAIVSRPPQGKPVLETVAFYPGAKTPANATLELLGKDLHAPLRHCSALLGGGEYQLLSVEAPNVPPAELKTAVGWRLKDMLDFPVAEATIDVLNIPGDSNAPVRNQSLFAVAARSSVIVQRQAAFVASKIELSVIDIPEMAQRNISAFLEPQGRGVAVLSFDADGGLLTVTFGAELYLSRRIDVNLTQLREADPDRRQQWHDKITLELQRSLDHFERQFHFIAVAKLVLAPTAADGLHAYLAANLYMPVEALDLSVVFDLAKLPELSDPLQQARYFLTMGAALRLEERAP
ncbi:MAG TPA: agglutinin biogenesis protein MshI [Janthinobacterium sp.]|nr:agglutinin biogenesis protein MshI [Janthinobacterium sp.]